MSNEFRLPRSVLPAHYDIRLLLDIDNFTFEGTVGVDIDVVESVGALVLHSAEIDVKAAGLASGPAVSEISYDEEQERLTLTLDATLDPGRHRVEMEFTGLINDQLRGLYRSTYTDADGVEHRIAASQCQATDARRVFPCWDEPDFKATFTTTMVVPAGLEAYSNGAEVGRRKLEGDSVEVEFATTMKMSTYLLAFVAGPFEATEPVVVRGVPIRIIVPKGNLHLTDIALENAVFCFEYLSDYYGIPYPADKLDHIAIPDFAAGAMENVGLITYRDAYLIIDPAKASQSELLTCLDVIGHEIAHQWFGNLVTMAWWEGAWLNEAFASFMEIKATEAKRPEWKRWLAFANTEVPWAMGTDQLASTRPIEFEVNAPSEVSQMFDAITYGKGSAVLHMMDEFIGVEDFRRGVGNYLRKHSYANTVTRDLWEGLDEASEWPVSAIMETWVYQKGFPQIEVTTVGGGVRLSQRRHLVIQDESDPTIWKVPIRLRGSIDGHAFERSALIEDDELTVDLGGELDWVVANAGGSGFYRTSYDADLFAKLLHHIDDLDDLERHFLVSDTMAFVRNGSADATRFLDLAREFSEETEQAIWSVITAGLAYLEHHALEESARPGFERYVDDLVGPAFSRLGWEPVEGESDLDRKLRGDLIVALGVLAADESVIEKCREIAARVLSDEPVDPEVATASLTVYARHGDQETHDTLWSAYKTSTTSLDQVRYLRGVSGVCTEEAALATLDKIVDGDIRTQDGFWVFARVLGGKAGVPAWKKARENWDRLLEAMPGFTRARIAEGISALSHPEVAADMRGFFAEHPVPDASRSIEQNLEKLDANVRLRERETATLTAYFGE